MSFEERAAIWAAVHTERRALSADLSGIPAEAWSLPSLSAGWDVHDVVAHLIDSAKTTRVGFVRRLIAARFDFDRDNAVGIARERRANAADTLTEFDRIATETKTPPVALATRLVETIVHGEDIRRPLGVKRMYPVGPVVSALRYQLKTPASIGGGRERAAGFRLVTTDSEFTWGTGREVQGTALALLLAVSGRPVSETEVTGEAAMAFLQPRSERH